MKQEQVQRMKARIHNRAYISEKPKKIESVCTFILVLSFVLGLIKCVPSQPLAISQTDKFLIDLKEKNK